MRKVILYIFLGIIISIIILSLSFVGLVPNCSDFSVEDYEEEIECGFKFNRNYGNIDDRFKAYVVGVQEIHKCFPSSRKNIYGIGMKRELFYDHQSDAWLLWLSVDEEDVLGGGYGCIMTSTGDIVSCWGEK